MFGIINYLIQSTRLVNHVFHFVPYYYLTTTYMHVQTVTNKPFYIIIKTVYKQIHSNGYNISSCTLIYMQVWWLQLSADICNHIGYNHRLLRWQNVRLCFLMFPLNAYFSQLAPRLSSC